MDNIIVITGASSGIGKALKELFEKQDIVITISRTIDDNPLHYSCDVSNEQKLQSVFEDIKIRFGRIDILINNAGYGLGGITELVDTDEIKKQFDVNFMGVCFCCKFALPLMKKGAKIVNISSAMALFPLPYRTFYSASKVAVLNYTFALRMECALDGIDVFAICPGDIKSTFTNNRIQNNDTNEKYGNRLKKSSATINKNQDKRMDCTKATNKMYHLILKKKSKPFVIIGTKFKLLYFLTRFTSKNLLLKITAKHFDGR